MLIFLYNLYIFGVHFKALLYLKAYYNEQCYKEVYLYWYVSYIFVYHIYINYGVSINIHVSVTFLKQSFNQSTPELEKCL